MEFVAELVVFLIDLFVEIVLDGGRGGRPIRDVVRILAGKPVASRRLDRYVC